MHRPKVHRIQRHAQRGVSLLFALLTLIALLLATLALVRSVDTNTMLLGNIGFKQDATAAADQAARQAIGWLKTNGTSLNANDTTKGYYASTLELAADGVTRLAPMDATGRQVPTNNNRQLIDWNGDACASAPSGSGSATCAATPFSATDVGSNKVSYAIFRLCSKAGDYTTDATINCAKPLATANAGASNKGSLNYSMPKPFAEVDGPYYRIVVRVQGARDTTSFTETLVHF